MIETKQFRLLAVVRTWELKDKPEFRGFHCGLCQDLLLYGSCCHLLHADGYLVPIHLCEHCKERIENGEEVEKPPRDFDRNSFQPTFSPKAERMLDRIVKLWDIKASSSYRPFACDKCNQYLEHSRAWHVWRNRNGTLIEYHFCQNCWTEISR